MKTIAGVLLVGAAPVFAQADDTARLATISARGMMLAAYDRAAWLGTDDMKSRLPDALNRVGGWIVDGPRDRPTVIFHDRAATPRALYEAQLVDGRLSGATLPQGDAATLSPERLRLIAARDTAVRAVTAAATRPCSTSFNTVVLPAGVGEPIRVYFLSAQTKADEVVIGGHYRVDIGADGKAGTPFAFSKGCMTMNRPSKEVRSPMMCSQPVRTACHSS